MAIVATQVLRDFGISEFDALHVCQRRSKSRPLWRRKNRPVLVVSGYAKAPDRGPWHTALLGWLLCADFAGVGIDDFGGGLDLLRRGFGVGAVPAGGGLLEPVAVPVHGQDMNMVGEPVE